MLRLDTLPAWDLGHGICDLEDGSAAIAGNVLLINGSCDPLHLRLADTKVGRARHTVYSLQRKARLVALRQGNCDGRVVTSYE